MKRKPLISNFNWNFGWILGQHDILVLGDVPFPPLTPPHPESEQLFLSKVRFQLADVHPSPQGLEKKSSKNEMLVFGLHSTSDDWLSNLSDES